MTHDQFLGYYRLHKAAFPARPNHSPSQLVHVEADDQGGRARTELFWDRGQAVVRCEGWAPGMWGSDDPVAEAIGWAAVSLWEERTGLAVDDLEILLL